MDSGAADIPVSGAERAASAPMHAPPSMRSALAPSDVLDRLRKESKRGKLAGFREVDARVIGALEFEVSVFGAPYDRRLVGRALPADGGGTVISFASRLDRRYPSIVIGVVLLMLSPPAIWMTHSFLSGWRWYHGLFPTVWWTCIWYLPLSLLALPGLWKQFRKSEAKSAEEASKVWSKIAGLIGGVHARLRA